MARLLITGGAGYIGSICGAIALQRGHEVIVVDDLSTGFRDAVPEQAAFYALDIADRGALSAVFRRHQIDAVFHFAAKALIPESVVNPGVFFDRNVAAGIALFETMRQHQVGKLIFSSTAAVYGLPQSVPIAEDHPTMPLNAYGESKLILEKILTWYARAYHWVVVAFRYFSAAGALPGLGERHHPETHLIPLVLEAAAGRRPALQIFGDDYDTPDGTCLRDFIHVRDLAEAHLRVVGELSEPGCHVFNVGSGRMYSVKEICAAAEVATGRPVPMQIAERRVGDPAVLCASPQRLMEALAWRPTCSDLPTILRDAWRWSEAQQRTEAVR